MTPCGFVVYKESIFVYRVHKLDAWDSKCLDVGPTHFNLKREHQNTGNKISTEIISAVAIDTAGFRYKTARTGRKCYRMAHHVHLKREFTILSLL